MGIGEWVILLLNILTAGGSASLGLFAILWGSFRDPTQHPGIVVYLLGGSLLLIALGSGLAGLLLLLRQTRLAAWLQWLAALGGALFMGTYLFLSRSSGSLQADLGLLAMMLFTIVLFVFSGWFLRRVGDEK